MLKTDHQEKVLTTTPARSTPETKLWRIPNNVNKEQRVHFRNQSMLDTHISTLGPLQKPKSDENPNHNHRTTTELHLRNQNLMELNLNNPHVHLVHIRNTTSDGSEQDMNQTQVFFPGSDYTSYQE